MRNAKNKSPLVMALLVIAFSAPSCRATSNFASGEQSATGADAGRIIPTRSMKIKRAAHTATLLPDGKVLVAGGFTGNESTLGSAEVFDPATSTFASVGNMNATRAGHTATLLPNGMVLIAGGYNGSYLASAEVYDPEKRTFAPTGRMRTARSGHTATLLKNGKVLLVGGTGIGWTFLADAELYDPATNSFTATSSMATARESHTATLLASGKVLITGGHQGRRPSVTIYSSAEIYDPTTSRFMAAANMTRERHKHDAILLSDGRVLIAGGSDERDGHGAYVSAEVYNPATDAFTATGNMNTPRYKLQGTAILLNNGKVLIAGGASRAEVFNPLTNTFSYSSGNFETIRLFSTATRLRDGQVLITGGYDDSNIVSSNAWIYRT